MKKVLYVGTTVLAFAFIIAFYYYLTIGEQTLQTNNRVTPAKSTVEQPCGCTNLSFLNRHLFIAPSVKPPLRATDWPFVVRSPYTTLDVEKSYAGLSQKPKTSQTMALNSANMQAQDR